MNDGVDKELFDKGITALSSSDDEMMFGRRLRHKIDVLLTRPKCNPYIQLQRWRAVGKEMIEFMNSVGEFTSVTQREFDRLTKKYNERNNARWTHQEDNLLIELKCKDVQEFEIATFLGRSVSAVNNRISYLVGIKRMRQDVDGKFYGTVNGVEYSGEQISGIIEK